MRTMRFIQEVALFALVATTVGPVAVKDAQGTNPLPPWAPPDTPRGWRGCWRRRNAVAVRELKV